MATAALQKTERIDVRLQPNQKEQIEKAAGIRGLSVTDFIVQNAIATAERTIHEHATWTLSGRDSKVFFTALSDPPAPARALMRAAARYRERYTGE